MMILCVGCEWQLKPSGDTGNSAQVVIERYDRIESLYLTTGDYSALQQMSTNYPMQTRMLIEDMLHLGKVDDSDINAKFLHYFQDSTLQALLIEVQRQYADMDDVNENLTKAFQQLKDELPKMEVPRVYTQISSFDQSIIVGNGTIGISLDKYLGKDYPFYQTHYTERQRQLMVRSMIVPDCIAFYLLSLYPLTNPETATQGRRDQHMGRIQWAVNKVVQATVFDNPYVKQVEDYMKTHRQTTIHQLLTTTIE